MDGWPQEAVASHQKDVQCGADPQASLESTAEFYGYRGDDLRAFIDQHVPGGYREQVVFWQQTASNKRTLEAKLARVDEMLKRMPSAGSNIISQAMAVQRLFPDDRAVWSAAKKRAAQLADQRENQNAQD
jgi:hypothetical protein